MIDDIEKLIDIVAASSVTEVTVRLNGRRVTVKAHPRQVRPAQGRAAMPAPVHAVEDGAEVRRPASSHCIVTAPLVGMFQQASPPVVAGTRVRAGQVVGYIESMKLMNEVRVESEGLVDEVLIDDGMPVEYGHPILSVSPV